MDTQPRIRDPRRAPYPQKIEFAYDEDNVLHAHVDGEPWGRIESPGTGWWDIFDASGRKRTRSTVTTADLRKTVERIAFADRKAAMKASPR